MDRISSMRSIAAPLLALTRPFRWIASRWFATIRARLYLAFGFAAALTIVGSLTAVYQFAVIGKLTDEMLSDSFPATVISLRLAEQSSSLVSSAPRLMTAPDEKARTEIMSAIGEQAKHLGEGASRLHDLGIAKADDINASREAVMKRIVISKERRYLELTVRKAHQDLLDSLGPAIDDANLDLMMQARSAGLDAASSSMLESLRRLLDVRSETNLLAGLLTEASLVDDKSRLTPLAGLIGSAKRKIEANLGQIADRAQQKKLGELYKQLGVIGGDDGIINLRTFELGRDHDAQVAFMAALSEATKLKG